MLNRKRISIVLSCVILLLTACGQEESNKIATNIELPMIEETQVETVVAETGDFVTTISGSLSVVYKNWIDLTWEYEDTYFDKVLVKSGQEVKKGEALIAFDVEASAIECEEQKLKLTRQKEQIEKKKQQLLLEIDQIKESLSSLSSRELTIAQLNIEKLQIEYEQYIYQSNQELEEQQQIVDSLEAKVNNNCLRAPFDGIVSKIPAFTQGAKVTKDQLLMTFYSTESFYLKVPSDYDKLQYGMNVSVEIVKNGNTTNVNGKVVAARNVFPNIAMGEVVIEIDKSITPEMLQESSIKYKCEIQNIPNVISVDNSVVHTDEEETFVYILEEDVVKKRMVVPGFRNSEKVWILDGLANGQLIITE